MEWGKKPLKFGIWENDPPNSRDLLLSQGPKFLIFSPKSVRGRCRGWSRNPFFNLKKTFRVFQRFILEKIPKFIPKTNGIFPGFIPEKFPNLALKWSKINQEKANSLGRDIGNIPKIRVIWDISPHTIPKSWNFIPKYCRGGVGQAEPPQNSPNPRI